MYAAQQKPDGTFACGEDTYRLEDRGRDHFAVRRLSDDKVVGGLQFQADRCEVRPELDAPAVEMDVLRAIASLLERPRGLLPLQ